MAYRLPSAWDPGYAMPRNALDEGLERRAITTKWTPRGTYDDPTFANRGGYALPGYVRGEAYGQEARVTDWQANGTYNGGNIPHWLNQRPQVSVGPRGPGGKRPVKVVRAMGDVESTGFMEEPYPEPFHSYGQKAARMIMSSVAGLPAGKKKAAIKKTLHTIDPSLYKRAANIANRHIANGTPAAAALQHGIARAMSAGMVAEILRTGKTKQAPAAKGQVGLGCYSRHGVREALGAVGAASGAIFKNGAPTQTSTGATGSGDGVCTSDKKLIYVAGSWRVRSPSDACVATATEDVNYVIQSGQPIFVGPFRFNPTAGAQVADITRPDMVPKKWSTWLQQVVKTSYSNAASKGIVAPSVMAKIDPTLTGPTNNCMNPDQCANYSGYKNICPPQTDPRCTTWQSGPKKGQPITYEDMRAAWGTGYAPDPTLAETGGTSLTTATDTYGNPVHRVTYADDPNAFSFYTVNDWRVAMGLPDWCFTTQTDMLVPGLGITVGQDLPAMLNAVVSDPIIAASHAPLAFFTHPITGKRWGLWIGLAGADQPANSHTYPPADPNNVVGHWNVQTDAPNSYKLQIGFAPYDTDPPWWKSVLQVVFWVPALLFDIIETAVGAVLTGLGDLACATLGDPAAVAGAAKAGGQIAGGAGAAAGAAGAALAQAACGSSAPPPVIITPHSDILPYLLLGGGALALVLVATGKKSKTSKSKDKP